MSVSIYQFTTSKFILNINSIEYITNLVDLIRDPKNLCDNGGNYPEDYYIDLVERNKNNFVLHGGDFKEVNYLLKHSAVHGYLDEEYIDEEMQNEMNEGIDIFREIQNNLKKNEYFFNDSLMKNKYEIRYSITLYHENGQIFTKTSNEIKNEMIDINF